MYWHSLLTLFLCFFLLTTFESWGQIPKAKTKEQKLQMLPRGTAFDEDCRLKQTDLKPIIPSYNTFFYNHNWNDDEKTETAQLSPERFVIIEQNACTHHRTIIKMSIAPEIAEPLDLNFYVIEMLNLMNRLYYFDPDYYGYKLDFQKELLEKLEINGIGKRFNFPLSDINFVVELDGGDWGSSIYIEVIKLVHLEKILGPGVKEYLDDGYFVGQSAN